MSAATRVAHGLTAHHWRYNRRSGLKLALCECGWNARFLRPPLTVRARRLLCLRGHDWEPPHEVHTGPVGFEESDVTLLGSFRQCVRCYRCERS